MNIVTMMVNGVYNDWKKIKFKKNSQIFRQIFICPVRDILLIKVYMAASMTIINWYQLIFFLILVPNNLLQRKKQKFSHSKNFYSGLTDVADGTFKCRGRDNLRLKGVQINFRNLKTVSYGFNSSLYMQYCLSPILGTLC